VIHVGLIGCGEHSEIGHAVPLARYKSEHQSELELSAVCDINAGRVEYFRSKFGFLNSYTNVDEMLKSQRLDVCIAVVPVEKITQLGIKLLELGMPCVVEKPLGTALPEVEALRDVARSTRTPNMVSVNRRFMPMLNRALAWARSAAELRYVRSIMTRHARTEPDFLWSTAVHAVDTLRYIAGDVRNANIRTLPGKSSAWYGIDLQFATGTIGRIDVLPTAGVLEESYELIGDGYRAIVTSPFGPARSLRCYQANKLVHYEDDNGVPEDVVFGFYDEAAALIRTLSNNEPLAPTIEDVYPSVELCLNLSKAAAMQVHEPQSC